MRKPVKRFFFIFLDDRKSERERGVIGDRPRFEPWPVVACAIFSLFGKCRPPLRTACVPTRC